VLIPEDTNTAAYDRGIGINTIFYFEGRVGLILKANDFTPEVFIVIERQTRRIGPASLRA